MICKIIGDTIALTLATMNPQCDAYASVAQSASITAFTLPRQDNYKYAVVSVGTVDPNNPAMRAHLYTLRTKIQARQVIWIAPTYDVSRIQVRLIAKIFGDQVVYFDPGKDGILPQSYKTLDRDIKRVVR